MSYDYFVVLRGNERLALGLQWYQLLEDMNFLILNRLW